MDPLTVLAAAKTAAAAAKTAIQVGKDIGAVVAEYNALINARSNLARLAATPPRGWGQKESAEQIAMRAFAAKKEAEEMENEIRNYIVSEWGLTAWDQIQREIAAIRKAQREAAIVEAQRLAEQKLVDLTIGGAAIATIGMVSLIIWAISL